MNNQNINEFLGATTKFRETFDKVTNDIYQTEINVDSNRQNFNNEIDANSERALQENDARIAGLQANGESVDSTIASLQSELESLNNNTHPRLAGLTPEQREEYKRIRISGINDQIRYETGIKEDIERQISELNELNEVEIQNNVDLEQGFENSYERQESQAREELIEAVNEMKDSFDELELPGGSRVSLVTTIQYDIERKLRDLNKARQQAAEELRIAEGAEAKNGYRDQIARFNNEISQLQALRTGVVDFLEFEKSLDNFLENEELGYMELKDKLDEFNNMYDVIEKNAPVLGTPVEKVEEAPKATEEVQEEKVEEVEETKEETPVEEVEETKVEEAPENLQTVEMPSAVVEQPVKEETEEKEQPAVAEEEPKVEEVEEPTKEEVKPETNEINYSTKTPKPNYDLGNLSKEEGKQKGAKLKIKNRRKSMISAAKAAGTMGTGACLLLAAGGLAPIGIPGAILVGAVVFPALSAGTIAVTTRLADAFKCKALNYELDKMAKEFGATMAYDYENSKAYMVKNGEPFKVEGKIDEFKEKATKVIENKLKEEESFNPERESKEIYAKYEKIFNQIASDDKYVEFNKSFDSMLRNNDFSELYNRFGGVAKSNKPVEVDEEVESFFKISTQAVKDKASKLKNLLANRKAYNLSDTVADMVENDIKEEEKIAEFDPSTLGKTDNIKSAIRNATDKLANIKDNIISIRNKSAQKSEEVTEEVVNEPIDDNFTELPDEVENVQQVNTTFETPQTATPVEEVAHDNMDELLEDDLSVESTEMGKEVTNIMQEARAAAESLEAEMPQASQTQKVDNIDYNSSYVGTQVGMNPENEGFVQDFSSNIAALENEKTMVEINADNLTPEEQQAKLNDINNQLEMLKNFQGAEYSEGKSLGR